VAPRQVCVALTSRDSHLRLEQALIHFPELALKLRRAPISSTERGAVAASRRLRRLCRGNVILLGDASGSVDAITGDGLRLSFEQAPLLASALRADDWTLYEAAHRRLSRRPSLMAHLLLSLDRRAWLRKRALRALASEPRVFAKQLAMHVGALSPAAFARGAILPLGWSILTALVNGL